MSELEELEELRKEKDQAYWERNQLVAALSKLFPAWLSRHSYDDKTWEDDWRWIVFIEIPTMEWTGIPDNRVDHKRQLSWHIHDSEFKHFSHLTMKENAWDGHSTEEKYRRLQLIAKSEKSEKSERHNETTSDIKVYTNMAVVEIIKSIVERIGNETLAEKDRQSVLNEPRDTQFMALAKSIIQEMLDQREGRWIDFGMDDKDDIEEYALIIARRLYDFADSIKHEVYGSLESTS